MKVEEMKSPKGNNRPDQIIIDNGINRMFVSYGTNIAMIESDGQVWLDEEYWDYSKTTGKYRNQFLDENKKETESKIKSGQYKLTNLN